MDGLKRKALGRGLDGLLPPPPMPRAPGDGGPRKMAITDLYRSPTQPRTTFDERALDELAQSLREVGFIEPIVARPRREGGYEIVAGERRWRAAQRAGLHDVPVYVRDLSDTETLEISLIENIQREDLNAIEQAHALRRLIDDHGFTQDAVAQRIGKDRTSVANLLRLLKLPEPIQEHIRKGELSEGHGRALLAASSVDHMLKLAGRIREHGWSVRQAEAAARAATAANEVSSGARAGESRKQAKSVNVRDLEMRLARALGASVSINEKARGRGVLQIRYESYDELDRLIERFTSD